MPATACGSRWEPASFPSKRTATCGPCPRTRRSIVRRRRPAADLAGMLGLVASDLLDPSPVDRHGIGPARAPACELRRGATREAARGRDGDARQQRPTVDGVRVRARRRRRPRALLLSQARRHARRPGHGLGVRQPRRMAPRDRRGTAAEAHRGPGRGGRASMPPRARSHGRSADPRVRTGGRDRARHIRL